MSVPSKYQLGVVKEGTFATPLTVTRFFEAAPPESIKPQFGRIESKGLRAGTMTVRSDRFIPYRLGAMGDVNIEVGAKGFGFWLEHMMGQVATTGPTDSKSTHTGTWASLTGKSLTAQHNMPFHPSDANQPFTFFGGKVAKWKIGNSIDQLLIATLSLDFADFDDSTALASASYPTGVELLAFTGCTVTIGGAAFEATDIVIDQDNALKVDRRYLRGSAIKKEQVEKAWRAATWAVTGDFVDMTQLARIKSATAAGAVAQIVATWTGVGLIGAASLPTVTVTIPAARFDEGYPVVAGPDPLTQPLKGAVTYDGTNSPITIAYGTADTTP